MSGITRMRTLMWFLNVLFTRQGAQTIMRKEMDGHSILTSGPSSNLKERGFPEREREGKLTDFLWYVICNV